MKFIFPITALCLLIACTNKKIENTETKDTIAVDTIQTVSNRLAFSPIENYSLKKNVTLPDSVNFMIIGNQEEFNQFFEGAGVPPDFIINYTVAIACTPTNRKTTIDIDRVEINGSSINVFVNLKRDEQQNKLSFPAKVYAIEKRDGIISIDFYQNEKMVKSLMLPIN